MSKGLEALEHIKQNTIYCACYRDYDIIEKELKALEIIKKCFYVAKSSGAVLLTSYGFDHKEELKEVLL